MPPRTLGGADHLPSQHGCTQNPDPPGPLAAQDMALCRDGWCCCCRERQMPFPGQLSPPPLLLPTLSPLKDAVLPNLSSPLAVFFFYFSNGASRVFFFLIMPKSCTSSGERYRG